MARPLRIVYEGAFYHITARGNERKKIFLSPTDYNKFLFYLKEALGKFEVILHAYTLMDNHYHLLIQTPKANLTSFMHTLNSAYTTYFNIKRRRKGHLLQGRYKAFLIDANTYLLELSRYIHMNPVRAGFSKKPEEYPYSSYLPYIACRTQSIVYRELIWGMLTKNPNKAPESYRLYVESALGEELKSPLEGVYGGVLLGPKSFIIKVLNRTKDEILQKKDISYKNTLTHKTSDLQEIIDHLSRYFKVPKEKIITTSPYKAYAVYLAKKHTPLSNVEIGKFFSGLTFSAVSKIGTRLKHRMDKNPELKDHLAKIGGRLSHVKA